MMITLYSEPNLKGDRFEFNPQNVNYIYYTRPDVNSPYMYQTTDSYIKPPSTYSDEQRFNIASVENESNDFFLVIVNLERKNAETTIQGTVNKTGFSDTYGYIQVVKNINNCKLDIQFYKNAMIVSICIFVAILLLLCFLMYTKLLKYQTNITFTQY